MSEETIIHVEKEFEAVESGIGWPSFFNGIRNECTENYAYEITEAKKITNKNLNRYRDVNPYDHSRIVLKTGPCDYINASMVEVPKAKRKYILTQGPLPHTNSHFWAMIWEQNCKAIIMLNRVIEKNTVKCDQYWPEQTDESLVFNEVGIKVINVSAERASYYTITTIRLEELSSSNCRTVLHFHYTTWPDFGCPQSPTAFLKFLRVVRASGALNNSQEQPAVVHCSAGIGRSGTFCLVDSCLLMITELQLDNVIVKDVLMDMRRFRMGLVQTHDQLRFSYLAIIEGIKCDGEELSNGVENDTVEPPELPPIPPPRGESLTRSQNNNSVRPQGEPLENHSPLSSIRQRTGLEHSQRSEKNQKLDKQIKDLKSKMQQSEYWKNLRRQYATPMYLGFALIGGGVLAYLCMNRN